jgi:hypothetical protein
MGLSCKGNHSTPEISGIAALCCNYLGVEITAMSDDDSPDLAHKIQALLPPRHILLRYQLLISRFLLDNITSSNSSLNYTSFSNSLELLRILHTSFILKLANSSKLWNSCTSFLSSQIPQTRTQITTLMVLCSPELFLASLGLLLPSR